MATAGRKKGTPKTGGRRKGTPNKTSLTMKQAVLQTFAELGEVTHMLQWARENPTDFYRIAAKLIPQQIQADVKNISDVNELSTEEIMRRIDALQGTVAAKNLATKSQDIH